MDTSKRWNRLMEIKMDNNKRWNRLMEINKKSRTAINSLKIRGNNTIEINLTLEELYEIALLSGNEATVIKRKYY